MSLLVSGLVVLLFLTLLVLCRVIELSTRAIELARNSMAAIADQALDDETKEKIVQQSALKLFRVLGGLIIGFFVALVAPLGSVYLLQFVGVVSAEAVFMMLLRWEFIALSSVVCVVAFILIKRLR